MDRLQRAAAGILLVMLVVIAYGLFGRIDADDQVRQQSEYCAMVAAHEHDHTTGWPDYRHAYKIECKAQQAQP